MAAHGSQIRLSHILRKPSCVRLHACVHSRSPFRAPNHYIPRSIDMCRQFYVLRRIQTTYSQNPNPSYFQLLDASNTPLPSIQHFFSTTSISSVWYFRGIAIELNKPEFNRMSNSPGITLVGWDLTMPILQFGDFFYFIEDFPACLSYTGIHRYALLLLIFIYFCFVRGKEEMRDPPCVGLQ